MKVSLYIAASLDGYIARENGDVDWLEGPSADSTEDFGYHAFMASVDALVMGRKSFEKVLSFGAWPYGEKPVVVLTSSGVDIPDELRDCVQSASGTPEELVAQFTAKGWSGIYLDGGETLQRFLRKGLVHQIIVTTVPILLGSGIPLFGPLDQDMHLKHIRTQSYENGMVQSEYQPVRT